MKVYAKITLPFGKQKLDIKVGENGRQPRPNGLVVSARKCAGPIPAKNRTSCEKSIRTPIFSVTVEAYFLHEVQFSAAIEAAHFPAAETGHLARSLLPFSPSCLFFI